VAPLPQDRLVRKEVSLGLVREIEPPQTHIGLTIAPLTPVATDEVIFEYAKGLTSGLAPARAEDAESELARKDDVIYSQGRASVLDWALKDHYTASDVSRYREYLRIQEQLQAGDFPLTIGSQTEDWQGKLARDTALRRRKLDNRLEALIMTSLETGALAYDDGKIKFSIDWGRPAGQQDEAPAGGTWNLTTSDPIGAINAMNDTMYDTYGVRMNRAIASRKVINSILNSDKFAARSGLAIPSGGSGGSAASGGVDPRYLIDGWGPSAAAAVVERATGVTFTEYDAVYRTRTLGGTTITNTRFMSDKKIVFLPDPQYLDDAASDLNIGFAATLSSPHPMGNWQSGFYEWERETTDPWGYDVGTGIKAFPVFPLLEYSYVMSVLP
jgi:hypothetical protein